MTLRMRRAMFAPDEVRHECACWQTELHTDQAPVAWVAAEGSGTAGPGPTAAHSGADRLSHHWFEKPTHFAFGKISPIIACIS
jgi:hypothetical protein